MNTDYTKEHQYLKAKKRVDKLKGFYIHLWVYILVNIFISSIIVYGLMKGGNYTFTEAIQHFAVYSTWLFWGIGMFFHGVGVFGFKSFLGRDWEERKLKELMEKES